MRINTRKEEEEEEEEEDFLKAVISIAPYLTSKGEQTALYKVNNNVYTLKPQK